MADFRALKRRIKSVKNISQVTNALEMVSAVKMKKAQEALIASTEYYSGLINTFMGLINESNQPLSEILEDIKLKKSKSESSEIYILLISPSKGFVGSMITNLYKTVTKLITNIEEKNDSFLLNNNEVENDVLANKSNKEGDKYNFSLISVEKKASGYRKIKEIDEVAIFQSSGIPLKYDEIIPITDEIIERYINGTLDKCYVVYTKFISSLKFVPAIKAVLPFSMEPRKIGNYITTSESPEILLRGTIDQLIEANIYIAMLNALASEFTSRMVVMKNATDNAKDLSKKLALIYNRQRQSAITSQIAELTSSIEQQ